MRIFPFPLVGHCFWWALVFFMMGISACQSDTVAETSQDLAANQWLFKDTKTFTFEIEEPDAYHLDFFIRQTPQFPYCNLYTHYQLISPKGDTLENRLAQHDLYDCKTGKPNGKGIGDYYEHALPLLENYSLEKGKYQLRLRQYMRTDTLLGVASIGFRLKRAE